MCRHDRVADAERERERYGSEITEIQKHLPAGELKLSSLIASTCLRPDWLEMN